MKNIVKVCLLSFTISSVLIVSCTKDEETTETPIAKQQASTLISKDGETEEQLKAKGWIMGEEFKVPDAEFIKPNNNSAARSSVTSLVSREDLGRIDPNYLNYEFMANRFTWAMAHHYGKSVPGRRPIGVGVNDFLNGSGHNPTNDYNWKVYKRLDVLRVAPPKITSGGVWRPAPGVPATILVNFSNHDDIHPAGAGPATITTYKDKSWYVGASLAVTVGGEVGIPLVAAGSVDVTMEMNAGTGGSTGRQVAIQPRVVGFRIPPRHRAILTLVETHFSYDSTFKIPVKLTGWVSSDWGTHQFYGSHFWALDAGLFFYEATNNQRFYTVSMHEEVGLTYKYIVRILPM
jgi:hypothetical protein